jgi:hypothetical protein
LGSKNLVINGFANQSINQGAAPGPVHHSDPPKKAQNTSVPNYGESVTPSGKCPNQTLRPHEIKGSGIGNKELLLMAPQLYFYHHLKHHLLLIWNITICD